jgi:hypothetical protein
MPAPRTPRDLEPEDGSSAQPQHDQARNATEVPRLRLVETQPFRSGIVLLRYRTA